MDGIPTDCGHRITLDEANWSVSVGNLFFSGEGGSSPWSAGCHFHWCGLSVEGAPGSFELYPLPDRQLSFQQKSVIV